MPGRRDCRRSSGSWDGRVSNQHRAGFRTRISFGNGLSHGNEDGSDTMDLSSGFAPHADLARRLLPHLPSDVDAAHDMSHLLRVWRTVRTIAEEEGGDLRVLAASTILHDCVVVTKDAAQRSRASCLAAERAGTILDDLGWTPARIDAVMHAIEAHSFSAGIAPRTVEARILQDADRLDAIGYIGVARCFHVAGQLGRSLYDPDDPNAARRALDDGRFTLDHFRTKLLGIANSTQTRTGSRLARERHDAMLGFLEGLHAEIGGNAPDGV